MTATAPAASSAPHVTQPWIAFQGTIAAVRQVSPSMVRITCTGPEFAQFGSTSFDQRIKLILPLPGRGFDDFPTHGDWWEEWRALPVERQNPIRTYTVRAFRREPAELDIDLVLHGVGGPASAWAATAKVGDPVAVLGPNARFEGETGGVEFVVPPTRTPVLLAGDETALPAIAAILEQVPDTVHGLALIEVPHAADRIELIKPAGVGVEWLVRDQARVGQPMLDSFARHAGPLLGLSESAAASDTSLDLAPETEDEPWDVPETLPSGDCYAWIAGESAMVRTLRRMLVDDFDVAKSSVAFMGYWRLS